MLVHALLFLSVIPAVTSEFFSPGAGPRLIWKTGEVQEVRYKTSFVTYTIALWQQNPGQGSAKLGPIIFQTTNGPNAKLTWLVQTYGMDLDSSNVFFLWLFEGDSSAQGNQSAPGQFSSAYFNITTVNQFRVRRHKHKQRL
ncbi:hypothetical protein TOPH_09216 [Tolypocladium ophioglossoides CBS 100239]|uniref:Uncharacterized protein n=1 Tax=Tolypocladium ophioglossoides (strain CBS 100239) TaxID=1163406 RepID=A0A0L0MW54_TOLOC|nr:hypothetical protein TOPH_09216 [Tolypocladium ophioglossoides CBS 100239]